MYVEAIRGLLFLLMPLFPKIPPSVDSGLRGKRPIKGSVTHLLPLSHTNTHTHKHRHTHSNIHTFSVPPLSIVYFTHTNIYTDTKVCIVLSSELVQEGIKSTPTHSKQCSLSPSYRSTCRQPSESLSEVLSKCSPLSICHSFKYDYPALASHQ